MRVLIVVIMLCLFGCRAVKRIEVKDRVEMEKGTELNAVALRAGTKERDVLTYWPDGRLYQFERLRERVDEAEVARLEVREKQLAERNEVLKEQAPLKFWLRVGLYVGIGLALVAGIWMFRKLS